MSVSDDPPRVVFLSPVGVVGGAERVLLAVARGVGERLPQATRAAVLLADGPLRGELERLGVRVEVVPLPPRLAAAGDSDAIGGRVGAVARLGWHAASGIPAGVGFTWRLRRALRRLDPDVVHSNGLKTHLAAALAVPRRVPVVWHVHDFWSQRPLMARVVGLLKGRIAAAVAISEAVRRDARSLLPGVPLHTVRNAIDTDHFAPAGRDGAGLDRLAGLPQAPPGTVRVGLVATYANWKGHDVFLDALARLPAGTPVRGYIVGGPIYATAGSQVSRSDLERRAAGLGLDDRVGFVPFQPDPADVYRMLDVVVHASVRPEPFGLTIAEAMSCGRPVVVAAAGGAAELFAEGVDALGHPPGDVAALTAAIARLASDAGLRDRLGDQARVTAVATLGHRRFSREMTDVLTNLAGRPAGER